MPDRSRKRPKDPNQLAHMVVGLATGQQDDGIAKSDVHAKNPAAVALGKLGGLKGGKARALALKSHERSEIAKKAALARWRQRKDGDN